MKFHCGPPVSHFGIIQGHPGKPSESILRPTWGHPRVTVPSWDFLGHLEVILGLSWAILGIDWAMLGPSWVIFGHLWALGTSWELITAKIRFSTTLLRFLLFLGQSWGHLWGPGKANTQFTSQSFFEGLFWGHLGGTVFSQNTTPGFLTPKTNSKMCPFFVIPGPSFY